MIAARGTNAYRECGRARVAPGPPPRYGPPSRPRGGHHASSIRSFRRQARRRAAVNKVRAGRSLKPACWKSGARACVALSFDSDHETSTLREGSTSPGRLAQGEYGARAGVPRILDLLRRHELRASFFVPGVIARLHPDEQRRVVAEGHEIGMHGWIHEGTSE